MDRLILHCDLNNFYASVECLRNPELAGQPLAVSGNPDKRHGVILAKNEIAKRFGVKTGDVIWEARQKAPGLVLVPPHFDDYMRISKQVTGIYARYSPRVEPFGSDECWLDCTGCEALFGTGEEIAGTLRRVVKEETGLTISVGVSFNKVFAKLGSDLKKPDATTVISKENFRQMLWHLPADQMLSVGRKTYETLKKMNIVTIGDLAAADPAMLKKTFGVLGPKMRDNALGLNTDPVREYGKSREIESVGHGMTAVRDIVTTEDAAAVVYYLADMVGARMRRYNVRGRTVTVHLRSAELKTISRQTALPRPTFSAAEIGGAAMRLIERHWRGEPLRTITVTASDLVGAGDGVQTDMFAADTGKNERLEKALDDIRAKYGKTSVVRASLMGSDFIYDKNEGEDFLPFQR